MDVTVSADAMMAQAAHGKGFLAALDQSGGSTPKALKQYGIPENAYSGDAQMFDLVHQMRARIITAPAFTGDRIIGAILFERTMDGEVQGQKVPSFLWEQRRVVPFLKVDKGLEDAKDGVRLMKPIGGLDALLERAVGLGVFGTKMRSVIDDDSEQGIDAIVRQQLEVAVQIAKHGLVPIVEPEVSIGSATKAQAEQTLLAALQRGVDDLPDGTRIMLKLTIPDEANLYTSLAEHPNVVRVVALSGGYKLDDACQRLAKNRDMIASFSRALIDDLKVSMTDEEFDTTLAAVVEKIYQASTVKA